MNACEQTAEPCERAGRRVLDGHWFCSLHANQHQIRSHNGEPCGACGDRHAYAAERYELLTGASA